MRSNRLRQLLGVMLAGAAPVLLAGCDEVGTAGGYGGMSGSARASHPMAPEMVALMEKKGVSPASAVLIRTFKKEAEFEIWKMRSDGRYVHLKTFPMCRWSGQLGPKMREGDRQVPEGFYRITPGQMNPNSQYYLSFNVGYPNAYDRAQGASGGSIFVHGACSSAGCFSMTDGQIDQIYAVAREAFGGGQQSIQMQSYPFHMTPDNLAKYRNDTNIGFWRQLKEGADNFEVSKQDVTVGVCNRHYVFNTTARNLDPSGPCPSLQHDGIETEVAARAAEDEGRIAKLSESTPAVRTIYADGGQNPEFRHAQLPEVSRPEALAAGPTEWLVAPSKSVSPVVKIAAKKDAAKVLADKALGDKALGDKALAAKQGGKEQATLARAKTSADTGDRTSSIRKPDGAAKPQAAL